MRLLKLFFAVLTLAPSAGAFAQGKGFTTLADPQPTESGKKVEVVEFFSYADPHCALFDPMLHNWAKGKGGAIQFKRIPVGFRPDWVPLQKVYYALESMGKLEELHPKVFHALHVERAQIRTDAEATALMVKLGVDKAKFTEAMTSFSINSKFKRATQLQGSYKVDQVPLIVVDGRYVTSPAVVGEGTRERDEIKLGMMALSVMDQLIAKSAKK